MQLLTSSSSKCSANSLLKTLELLAPARTAEIGIAAVDCGVDAVYIAGPSFGARRAASNSMDDVRRLVEYAHRFGVRVFLTVNTIIYEEEIPEVRKLLQEARDAGIDALIVQDPAVLQIAGEAGIDIPMHASTQCSIRTPEKARFYESLGFSRLVLERELSLKDITEISSTIDAEIEFFVHGALCVCYSGQCYLSEYLTGRSANRGECAQPCRSLYDLTDAAGHTIVRRKALLSLKDYNLITRLEDLALAGVSSFKIEGRLKNASYVRNVVRAYSDALDALVARYPDRFCRSSFGRVSGGFTPDLDKTFNRGYTTLWLDGRRGPAWSSMDTPKSMGEDIGTVSSIRRSGPRMDITIRPAKTATALHNGDGFAFPCPDGDIIGFRADTCNGLTISTRSIPELYIGARLYRNINTAFEKTMDRQNGIREISVNVDLTVLPDCIRATAATEDGRSATIEINANGNSAEQPGRMLDTLRAQLSKRTSHYTFSVNSIDNPEGAQVPFFTVSSINAVRRDLAARLDAQPVNMIPMPSGKVNPSVREASSVTYKSNIANSITRALYAGRGASSTEDAYEISHRPGAELMRTRYCIRYELGICPVHQRAADSGPLFLVNNSRRLALEFDCRHCEMVVREAGLA